jgi:hypothetical protein
VWQKGNIFLTFSLPSYHPLHPLPIFPRLEEHLFGVLFAGQLTFYSDVGEHVATFPFNGEYWKEKN